MEIRKPNDIFVATINNPQATTYDLMTLDLNPDNTDLLSKDEYKESKYVKDMFTGEDGKFNDIAFDNAYTAAAYHFQEMTDDKYIQSLSEVQYSPFDITRPKDAKTFNVNVEFAKDFNPFKDRYSRSGINSIDPSSFSLRELAQQSKVFDPKTNSWSEKSANDLSFRDKFFGDTLVYAQWEEEGQHIDPETGRQVSHKKGDWKVNEDGNLYLEKLAGREIYGKQVVNAMDLLTTDGSVANNFDFFDADGREKSILKTSVRLAAELAPLLIPGFNKHYAGVKAALGLASVMPTFYKSFEGILLGEHESAANKLATAAEGYISKFTTQSFSDEAQGSFFNYEQMSQMVADIFSQIYEQRAMASLSKYMVKNPVNMSETEKKYMLEIEKNVLDGIKGGKINTKEAIEEIQKSALEKIPNLKSFQKSQSALAKSLSLGYMALTSTADIYGEAINGGYDRRTAGFAAILAASGQYGIMMNNEMGTWFLDKTTGYSANVNKALVRKTAIDYLEPVKKAFAAKTKTETKFELAKVFKNFKHSLVDTFTSPSELGEAMWKNAFVEGIEEVTEQLVLDATKGAIDTLSYLGLTKKEGSFGGWENTFSKEGLQNYLANFVGGLLGGAMFEFNISRIEPFLSGKDINKDVKRDIYKLVANSQTDLLIEEINKQRYKLGNNYLSPPSNQDEDPKSAKDGKSEADVIADTAIGMIKRIDGVLNHFNLKHSDDDIIKKAMLDYLIIQDLNQTKNDKGSGIDGIILDDYYNSLQKITEIQSKIQELSGKENESDNKESIKQLKEESKIYENKVKDILEGKNAEKYYNEMLFYLSKPISSSWLAIDKEVYTRTKYKVDFDSLPEHGLGISKESVEKEWKDYLDSSDLRKHIEVATAAYLDLEKNLNPSIEQYVSSGYDVQRARTYQLRLDLDSSIKLFNTSNPDKKEEVLNKIRFINEQLKENSSSKMNVTPWDVLQQDLGKKIVELGMVGKATITGDELSVDKNGNLVGVPYVQNELNEVLNKESGLTRKKSIEEKISMLFSDVPINPLDMDASIKVINTIIVSRNNNIDKQIRELLMKPDKTDEETEQIKMLNLNRIDFILLPYSDSVAAANIVEKKNKEEQELYQDVFEKTGVSEDTINKYKSADYFNFSDKKNEEETKTLDWLVNTDILHITPEFVESLPTEIKQAFDKTQANLKLNQEESLYNRILKVKESLTMGQVIKENEPKIEEFIDLERNLYESFNEELEKSKPEILKMRNYALDLLLEDIKGSKDNSPTLDGEMIDSARKMVNDIVDTYKKRYFENFSNLPIEDIMYIINNSKELANRIKKSKFLNIEEQIDDDPDSIQNKPVYTYEAYLAEFKDDPIMKFVSESTHLNFLLRNSIASLSELDDLSGVDQVNSFLELAPTIKNKIDNPLYKLLKTFELSLRVRKNESSPSVFDVLEREDKSLLSASDINNYLAEGIKLTELKSAINVLNLVKSVVAAMSTTQVGFEDPYGFIASRQAFLKKHKIESDAINLKTISSDTAVLMLNDLNRIEVKLQFYLDLSKSNDSRISMEQETIGNKMQEIFYDKLKDLINLDVLRKLKPKFEEIDKNSNKSKERKLMEVESLIYEEFKNSDKVEILNSLLANANIVVDPRKLSKITKEVEKKDINDYDFAIYLATTLSVHSRDFNSRMNKLITSFDKAPFFSQELAMKVVYGSLVDPKLFSKIIELDTVNSHHNVADLITFILGNGGTGKTTVVFKMLIKYLQQTNPDLSIWFAGPEMSQAAKLKTDVLGNVEGITNIETFSKYELYNKLGIKDIMINIINDLKEGKDESDYYSWSSDSRSKITLKEEVVTSILNSAFKDEAGNLNQNLPNLIFIDEVTHFSTLELEVLNMIMKSLPSDKTIKIVAAGDTSQNGFKYGINSSDKEGMIELNIDRIKGVYPPKLTVSVRSSNVWQRENLDLTISLSEKITNIFHGTGDPSEQDKLAAEILETYKQKKLFNLKVFRNNNTLHGTLFEESLSDQTVDTIKSNLSTEGNENKNIGILTETGNFEPYRESLNKMGLVNPDGTLSPRVKVFTLDNIQGDEIDFFIFNTNLIKSSRIHHRLKEFYTYISRAKDGTVVIDEGNKLTNEYNIINSHQTVTDIRPPLSIDKIEETRNKRLSVLSGLLDNNFKISYDNFQFGKGVVDIESDDTSPLKENDVLGKPLNTDVPPMGEYDDFKYMFHTFYNNANVKLKPIYNSKKEQIGVELDKIKYSKNNSNTDLNIDGVDSQTNQNEIIDGWLNVKNYYTYNKKLSNDPDSIKFFGSIFGSSIIPSKIKASVVVTASRFDINSNVTLYKKGFDIKKVINDKSPFINLSLKLEYNGKVHYVTLASISANTVESWFGSNSESNSLYAKVIEKLNKELKNDYKDIIELNKKNDIDYKQITSIRFLSEDEVSSAEPTSVKDTSKHKGLKKSEIRLFPTDKKYFDELINSYSFGEKRKEEDILARDKDGNIIMKGDKPLVKTPGLNTLFETYKGKPYIIVSFNQNDLNGSLTNDVQAKIIPLITKHRSVETTRTELIELRKIYFDSSEEEKKKMNYLFKNVVSTTEIIDILINISENHPDAFDNLLKPVSKIFNNTPLSYLKKVTGTHDNKSEESILTEITNIFEKIKSLRGKSKIEIKSELKILFASGNFWKNYIANILIIDDIIKAEKYKSIEVSKKSGTNIEEELKIYDALLASVSGFNAALKTESEDKIYWNVVKTKEKYVKSELTSNKDLDKYNPESFLYFNGTPESPRLLINLENTFSEFLGVVSQSTNTNSSSTSKQSTKVVVNNPNPQPTPIKAKKPPKPIAQPLGKIENGFTRIMEELESRKENDSEAKWRYDLVALLNDITVNGKIQIKNGKGLVEREEDVDTIAKILYNNGSELQLSFNSVILNLIGYLNIIGSPPSSKVRATRVLKKLLSSIENSKEKENSIKQIIDTGLINEC